MSNIAITGVNFINKGAELMTLSILKEFSNHEQYNNISAPLRTGNFKQRNCLGVGHFIFPKREKTLDPQRILKLTSYSILYNILSISPNYFLKKYSLFLEEDINVILDASGFVYSDQWGKNLSEYFSQLYLQWYKQGKKIILLPQAFGPFNNKEVKKAFLTIVECSTCIYARDEISYKHLVDLVGIQDKIRLAPDFTNLLEGIEDKKYNNLKMRPCIIPNTRMIDKQSESSGENYYSLISSIINRLIDRGLEPFILVHEINDVELSDNLKKSVKKEIPVINEENPLLLKGIIKNCSFVISSRFHGLISSLSQGVPCLGAGWSHKYRMLFQDYKCLDLLMNVEDDLSINLNKLNTLIDKSNRDLLQKTIADNAFKQKELSKKMWNEVKMIISN